MGGGFRRPHPAPPAGGKTPTPPSPGRHRAASPGRWAGCGAGGPLAPRAAAGTSPKRTTGGPQTGGRPHPAAGPLGGPPPGEVGLGAGGARTQARPPTPRPGGRSQRPGHRPTAERPGGGAAAPRTQAASNETGRIPYLAQPDTSGGGRATATGAAPAAGRSSARDSGRAEGPRGGRIRSRGHPSRSWGGVGGKKNAGRLAPRLDTTGRKKMRGGRFVPPACRYSGYQISPCSA